MAYDVFISHSSRDKSIADAVCATLEAQGIRCWIAPRDIRPGENWSEAIIRAIKECRVMVLVFSGNANASRQVGREVQRAFERDVTVIPFRVEAVDPCEEFEYYISSVHWLDALTPPLQQHIDRLVDSVRTVLEGGRPGPVAHSVPVAYAAPAGNRPALRRLPNVVLAGGAATLLLLLGTSARMWMRSRPEPSPAATRVAASSEMGEPETREGSSTRRIAQAATGALAQISGATPRADVRQAVQEGYRDIEQAMNDRSLDAYKARLAPGFVQIKQSGQHSDAATHLALTQVTLRTAEQIDARYTLQNVEARGADEATARVGVKMTVRSPLSGSLSFEETDEDTWTRNGDRWLLKESKTVSLR